MSKRSFNEIEQSIKNAVEAHEPAFDEAAWNKMETLLDKEKDRKRPVIFWLWWLLPLAIGGAMISYYAFNGKENQRDKISVKNNKPLAGNTVSNGGTLNRDPDLSAGPVTLVKTNAFTVTDVDGQINKAVAKQPESGHNEAGENNGHKKPEALFPKNKIGDNAKAKMKTKIIAGVKAFYGNGIEDANRDNRDEIKSHPGDHSKSEDLVIVNIDGNGADDKSVEKIVDSVITKTVSDRKSKNKIARFYVIVSTGAEGSGVKLLSVDKITARHGLSIGYQFNKNISAQAGFYSSTKKYKAGPGDYKTKPGSYWNTVRINKIEAQCKVYEIPVSLRYDFMPGKKLHIFASAGLSSYIMDKEEYYIYYDRYGVAHQAETNYSGNKSLFSVLRLSAGAEKKISRQFSIFASPGIAIPLAGVGEGEVKLYSVDLGIGLKYTPSRKK